MSALLPIPGPTVRDELARLSTAALADDDLGTIPALEATPPPGRFLIVDGRGLYVRRTETSPSAGPDAWYLHGLAASSTNWTSLAGALTPRATGYLVDLPAHGRSDPPPRGRYRLTDVADLLATAIATNSPGPVHLVGNSLGGMVAVLLAARHPALIATLTLISPAVPDLRLTRDRGADPRLALLLLPGTTRIANQRMTRLSPGERARGMAQLCFGDASAITTAQYDAAAADLAWRSELPWVNAGVLNSLRALMRSYPRVGSATFRRLAASITAPTLVIWGTRDRLVDPRLAAPTAAAFPQGELLVLPGLGHAAQMEDPRTTARALAALWSRVGLGLGAPHRDLTSGVATSSA